MIRSASHRRRLAALTDTPVNYDTEAVDFEHPPPGWTVDDRTHTLPAEEPGDPVPGGSFEIAVRLIRGYEFADPSLVRATYDPDAPLLGRTMLLELRALGLVSVHVGVRIIRVDDDLRTISGRRVRIFGWAYRTLQGHVEQGQMEWHVWKWLDTGQIEFHVHAVSRIASIRNPFIWVGFRVLHDHERELFLRSTGSRMQQLTESALRGETLSEGVRAASQDATARRGNGDDPAHEALAHRLSDG